MPDQGLQHNKPVNHLPSLLMGYIYKEIQIHFSNLLLFMKPFKPIYNIELCSFTCQQKFLGRHKWRHCCTHLQGISSSSASLTKLSLSFFLPFLAFAFSNTNTHTRGDQSVEHHGKTKCGR